MKTPMLAGLALIVFGIVSLAYQGVTYTTHKKILDIGSIDATTEQKKTIPLPPVLGCDTLMGGASLLVFRSSKNS